MEYISDLWKWALIGILIVVVLALRLTMPKGTASESATPRAARFKRNVQWLLVVIGPVLVQYFIGTWPAVAAALIVAAAVYLWPRKKAAVDNHS